MEVSSSLIFPRNSPFPVVDTAGTSLKPCSLALIVSSAMTAPGAPIKIMRAPSTTRPMPIQRALAMASPPNLLAWIWARPGGLTGAVQAQSTTTTLRRATPGRAKRFPEGLLGSAEARHDLAREQLHRAPRVLLGQAAE